MINQQPLFISGPRSIGDIVGDAIRLARGNIMFLIRTLLMPSALELAGRLLIIVGLNIIATTKGNIPVIIAAAAGIMLGMLISTIAAFFLSMRQLAIFRLYAGFADTYADAYKFVAAKKFEFLGVFILTWILFCVVLIFWCFELGISVALAGVKNLAIVSLIGVLWGVVGLYFTSTWSFLPFSMVAPAIAIENQPFSKVLSSNLALAFSTLIRGTLFLTFLGIVIMLLSTLLNLPSAVLSGMDMIHNWVELKAFSKPVNIYIQIFASVWRSGANLLLAPIIFLSCGFFYLDLRSRAQGLDLHRRLELMEKPATAEF